MNCLLVAATPFEIAPFLDKWTGQPDRAGDFQLDVLVSGIGLTAATWSITRQLQLKKYDMAIQAGIAGCFNRQLPLGSVVSVGRDSIADQGVLENGLFKTVFDMKLAPENRAPYKKGWLQNPHRELLKKTGLKAIKSISVNEITTGRARIKLLEDKYQAVTESMEGAAFHYACLMEGVPFMQVRSLSNYIGERNKTKWKMKNAIIQLNTVIEKLVSESNVP
ncbi:MAG TPA: futalosine hydrolase [Chitinophagaceae bacterium]|jgi:futalosine hydrolase